LRHGRVPDEGGYRRRAVTALGLVAAAGVAGIAADFVWLHLHGGRL
jgi:hypothetical protein